MTESATLESELLAQPLAILGSVQGAMQQALAGFYADGPTGEHYPNLEGPYTMVGCGVYIATNWITLVQDFR